MYTVLLFIFAVLILSIFIGGPVSTTVGFTAILAMAIFVGKSNVLYLGGVLFTSSISENNLVIPMFILMAEFMTSGGIAEEIFYVLSKMLRKVKGGLAVATTLACTVFAALCGSSPATAATLGKISIHEMVKRGYREDFAVGVVAGGGTLGIMIPPSVTLAMFGILTETSIVKLLMAGLIPGILLSLMMCVSCILRVRWNPELIGELKKGAEQDPTRAQVDTTEYNTTIAQDIKLALPAFVLIAFLLLSMYTGIATATECAGIGSIAALILALARRKLTKRNFATAMNNTVRLGCMNILQMTAGLMLSYVISRMGIATALAQACVNFGVNRWVVMAGLFVLWYFLGTIMSPTAMVVLTVPFVFPALRELGFDPYWIGIVSTLCVEVGMITPPVGANLFILRQTTGYPIATIIKGTIPYVLVLTLGLIILCFFPVLATFIPSMM